MLQWLRCNVAATGSLLDARPCAGNGSYLWARGVREGTYVRPCCRYSGCPERGRACALRIAVRWLMHETTGEMIREVNFDALHSAAKALSSKGTGL